MAREWPKGWVPIVAEEHRRAFENELASEVGGGHVLHGLVVMAIARADGRDDFLFSLQDGRVADVHLTFANRPERPPWPNTAVHISIDAWRAATHGEERRYVPMAGWRETKRVLDDDARLLVIEQRGSGRFSYVEIVWSDDGPNGYYKSGLYETEADAESAAAAHRQTQNDYED